MKTTDPLARYRREKSSYKAVEDVKYIRYTEGNWTWRCLPGDYNKELADWLYEETKIYDRLN